MTLSAGAGWSGWRCVRGALPSTRYLNRCEEEDGDDMVAPRISERERDGGKKARREHGLGCAAGAGPRRERGGEERGCCGPRERKGDRVTFPFSNSFFFLCFSISYFKMILNSNLECK